MKEEKTSHIQKDDRHVDDAMPALDVLKHIHECMPVDAWRSLIDLFPGPAYVRKRSGEFVVVNQEFADFVGAKSANILLGLALNQLQADYPLTAILWQQDLQTFRNGLKSTLDEEYSLPDKSHRILRNTRKPFCRMGLFESESILSISFDVTGDKIFERQLKDYDNYDSLTGLANRNLIRKRLKHAILRNGRLKAEGALLLLNIDKFREINEIYGHNLGDDLLRVAAKTIEMMLLPDALLARLSADEFAVLLPQIKHEKEAENQARTLIDLFDAPFIVQERRLSVSLSVGVIYFAKHGEEFEELFKGVDLALDYAKKKGGGNFQVFDPVMNAAIQRRQDIATMLRNAIENDEFELYYQPYVSTHDETILGMETLVRWNRKDPTKPKVSPAEFIPIAEETGLILSIGEWVIQHAFRERALWVNNPHLAHAKLSINISCLQFKQEEFLSIVEKALQETGVQPAWIEFEITESTLMDEVDRAIDIMEYLHDLGICLAIDDFGTGYSSLSYLKKFPIHKVKIDRSFVKDITVDSESASITKAIISLGHSLGLTVVAEGVETQEQLSFLHEFQCDIIQGYFYSQPLSTHQLKTWLENFHQARAIYCSPFESQGGGK